MLKKFGLKSLLGLSVAAFAALAQQALANNSAWINGKVLATAEADGSGADAPHDAGVTLVRLNIPSETAVQLAGPDPVYPTMIFDPKHAPCYFLVDAGAQWSTGLAQGQQVLAVLETYEGQHGWHGAAYAGAVAGSIDQNSKVSGLTNLPDTWMRTVPVAQLLSAGPGHIQVQVGHYDDMGGQALDLSLWRRAPGNGSWAWLTSLSNPAQGQFSAWDDGSVAPESLYEYGVNVEFSWLGGQGAGARPSVAGIYSGNARSVSNVMAASLKQPTPTPIPTSSPTLPTMELPEGWLAYPNPVVGEKIMLLFDMEGAGAFHASAFTLNGEKALEWGGSTDKKGRCKSEAGIAKLAAGIYLLHLHIDYADGSKKEFPERKIAILK